MESSAVVMSAPDRTGSEGVSDAPLLFCPFCRECFEGIAECPEHELALVPFDGLPRDSLEEAELPHDDEPLGGLDPRFGRGYVMAGVALSFVAFATPLIEVATATQSRAFSGYAAALERAPNLWTIPFVATMFAAFLARRRTPAAMRGARLAGLVLAFMPMLSFFYSFSQVRRGAREIAERAGQLVEISVGWGVGVLALACLAFIVGSYRLGVPPRAASAALPSADPEAVSPLGGRRRSRKRDRR